MALLGRKKHETFDGLLGIDIGPSGVKVVEFVAEKGRVRLSTYGYGEMDDPGQSFTPLADLERTAKIIRDVMTAAGMKAERAVAALPSAQIFQAVITIPAPKSKEETRALVEAQAAKLLPLPIAEMMIDSMVLDKEETRDKRQEASGEKVATEEKEEIRKNVRVLVTAAPKAVVEKYIELFKKTKLELVSLETEVFALIRSLVGKDKSRMMIVDVGMEQTNIAIVDKGVPYLHRTVRGGGGQVTEALSGKLGVGLLEAERMKRDLAAAGDTAEPPAAVREALSGLVHEIKYALDLFAQQSLGDSGKVDKIILTGGSALLPALDSYLTKLLNSNVYVGNPWARVAAPAGLRPVLDEIGPRLAVAVGLAARIKDDTVV